MSLPIRLGWHLAYIGQDVLRSWCICAEISSGTLRCQEFPTTHGFHDMYTHLYWAVRKLCTHASTPLAFVRGSVICQCQGGGSAQAQFVAVFRMQFAASRLCVQACITGVQDVQGGCRLVISCRMGSHWEIALMQLNQPRA